MKTPTPRDYWLIGLEGKKKPKQFRGLLKYRQSVLFSSVLHLDVGHGKKVNYPNKAWKYRQSFLCHTVMHLEIGHDNNDNYPHNVKISLVYCGHYEEHEFRLTMCG